MAQTQYGQVEEDLRLSSFHKKYHLFHLNRLKQHSETRDMSNSSKIKELKEYVFGLTRVESVLECKVYSVTNDALLYVIKKAKEESECFDDLEERAVYEHTAESLIQGKAFYSLGSKEVYYVTDLRYGRYNIDNYKPDRFNDDEWRRIQIRNSVVHELFHCSFDYTTSTRNEMLQEEYAYMEMIGWSLNHEGLTEEEIANFIVTTYGERIECSANPAIDANREKDLKILKQKGIEYGKKLIKMWKAKQKTSIEEEAVEQVKTFDPFGLEF